MLFSHAQVRQRASNGDRGARLASHNGAWTMWIDLPSNGWVPGQFMMAMQVPGEFHAEMTENGAEAWVGERTPTTWLKNYQIRFAPTELIAPAVQPQRG
jgi:hypothetical protein